MNGYGARMRIADIGEIVTGTTPSKYFEGGWGGVVPFLTHTDIAGVDYRVETARSISRKFVERQRGRVLPANSTAVVCIGSTIGKVARTDQPTLTNQQINSVVPDTSRFDPLFIYYRLGQLREELPRYASGSATPILNKTRFGAVEVDLPPLVEQRRIARVLGALDDLIDSNERLSVSVADLRSEIVNDALNDAVERVPLSSLAEFVNGKNFTKHAEVNGLPIIRTPEVRNGISLSTLRTNQPADIKNQAHYGDILLVWSGSLLLARWSGEAALVNQHIFKVIPSAAPDWLVFSLIEHQMPWFLSLAADKATTMGHIQRGHLDSGVPMLSNDHNESVGLIVQPLWKSELKLLRENSTLRKTRDELLPLLMSGKIRVREAEEQVGALGVESTANTATKGS